MVLFLHDRRRLDAVVGHGERLGVAQCVAHPLCAAMGPRGMVNYNGNVLEAEMFCITCIRALYPRCADAYADDETVLSNQFVELSLSGVSSPEAGDKSTRVLFSYVPTVFGGRGPYVVLPSGCRTYANIRCRDVWPVVVTFSSPTTSGRHHR